MFYTLEDINNKIDEFVSDKPEFEEELINDIKCDVEDILYVVSNCNKSEEEILPLPLYWLDIKLEQNGSLKSQESKMSY